MGFNVILQEFSFPADAVNGQLEWIGARLEHFVEAFPQGVIYATHALMINCCPSMISFAGFENTLANSVTLSILSNSMLEAAFSNLDLAMM